MSQQKLRLQFVVGQANQKSSGVFRKAIPRRYRSLRRLNDCRLLSMLGNEREVTREAESKVSGIQGDNLSVNHSTMPIQKLLFIDTNIWLDFYRVKNEVGLNLLKHVEAVADRIIVTFQVESEFKKNRQGAIAESLRELKAIPSISRPGIFSDAKAVEVINKQVKDSNKRLSDLRARLIRALDNPPLHDPIYKACQRIFHKQDNLVLTRENKLRNMIRRKAFKRFLHGCPPRKSSDTSIGDAFNWEWMIHCANENNAELVIISRDQDYGLEIEKTVYINDHLRQEFSERVSKKHKLLLYNRLSEGLKHFKIPVTAEEEAVETEIIAGNHDLTSRVKDVNVFLSGSRSDSRYVEELLKAFPNLAVQHGLEYETDSIDPDSN